MENLVHFWEIPFYLKEDALEMANASEYGRHDYCCENVSDDFMFRFDEENDIVVSAVYRRYGDGLMAF